MKTQVHILSIYDCRYDMSNYTYIYIYGNRHPYDLPFTFVLQTFLHISNIPNISNISNFNIPNISNISNIQIYFKYFKLSNI